MFAYTIPPVIKRIKIDIGLSYNAPHSQIWLDHDADLFVFGFEPNPESVKCLQGNSIEKREANHGQPLSQKNKPRFHLFPFALSNVEEPTEMDFYIMQKDCGTSSLHEPCDVTLGPIQNKVKVPVFSLAHFFQSFPNDRFPIIEYIKVDAQGSDLDILKGAKHYLSEHVVFITAEPESKQYKDCESNAEEHLAKFMKENGFFQIQHPNTSDPTFVNQRFLEEAKHIFIYQRG